MSNKKQIFKSSLSEILFKNLDYGDLAFIHIISINENQWLCAQDFKNEILEKVGDRKVIAELYSAKSISAKLKKFGMPREKRKTISHAVPINFYKMDTASVREFIGKKLINQGAGL